MDTKKIYQKHLQWNLSSVETMATVAKNLLYQADAKMSELSNANHIEFLKQEQVIKLLHEALSNLEKATELMDFSQIHYNDSFNDSLDS